MGMEYDKQHARSSTWDASVCHAENTVDCRKWDGSGCCDCWGRVVSRGRLGSCRGDPTFDRSMINEFVNKLILGISVSVLKFSRSLSRAETITVFPFS